MSAIDIKKLNEYIYLLRDPEGSTAYVVVGSKKTLVIDTMNGTEDIKKVVETITKLPLQLINTHGHPDHIGGNLFFGEAWIHPADLEIAKHFLPKTEKTASMKWQSVHQGEQIDLGDVTLKIYLLEGHTAGSIGLLDCKSRLMFTGDSVNDCLWMQFDHSSSIAVLHHTLNELEKIRTEFDFILTGHGNGFIDATAVEELNAAVGDMLLGKNEKDVDYTYFGGTVKAHPYGELEPYKLVVYNPNRQMM